MRNYTAAIVLFWASGVAHAEPEIVPVKISVECIPNLHCRYDGGNMNLEFTVTNMNSTAISLPVAYIVRRGPFIKITDRVSKRQISVGTGIPDYRLRKPLTILAPGESFKFTWLISKYEIEELPSRPIDASAEVALIDLQNEDEALIAKKYIGRTSFQITQ